MNWSRGLFRLWVAVSVLWLAAAGSYFNLTTCTKSLPGHCARGWWGDKDGWRVIVPIEEAFGWTFGPPLALLLLGLTAYWITRGFRRPPPP